MTAMPPTSSRFAARPITFRVGLLGALAVAGAFISGCIEDDLGVVIVDVNEVHYQGGGTADVLFVIDNSGSMGEEQAALGRGFEEFIESFLALDTDFHLGVTNMDYVNNAGALLGDEKVLTPETDDLIATFIANSRVGTGGSGTEKGMEAARQALGPAKRDGVNAGFFRNAAQLVVIFVSDEDDQSTGTNEEYDDYFLDLKFGDRRLVSVNAIAGPSPSGCATADPGTRYKEMTDLTGGTFTNICDEDLGMPQLGRVLSGYKTAFDLQGQPELDSVTVAVNGEVIEGGPDTWQADDQGRVVFSPGSVPADCSEVQFSYRTRDRVSTAEDAFVFETDAPVCAGPNTDLLEVRRSSCSNTGSSPALFAALLLLGIWRRPRRQRRL